MLLRLYVLISFWCYAVGTIDLIREGFVEMTNDLPHRAIEDIVSKQSEMIQIIQTYTSLTLSFQEDYLTKEERMTPSKKDDQQIEQVNVDVHTDVIFVGFPAAAVESVRSRWFEPLSHEDPMMASVGIDSHVVVLPGQLKYLNHFHIPQISFHVAESIKEYITKLLLRSDDGGESYINSWELEEILEELVGVINITHNLEWKATGGPDSTLFILNIDLGIAEKNISYSYRNGYSAKDLAVMASDPEVHRFIGKLLDANRATRIDLPANQTHPLFEENKSEKYQNRFSVER